MARDITRGPDTRGDTGGGDTGGGGTGGGDIGGGDNGDGGTHGGDNRGGGTGEGGRMESEFDEVITHMTTYLQILSNDSTSIGNDRELINQGKHIFFCCS